MEFVNSETRMNLARSFAGEAQARARYTAYAAQARKEGLEWIARIFEETADNEAIHAKEFLEQIQMQGGMADNLELNGGYPFLLGKTQENLRFAALGEWEEHSSVYPQFAELARREGFPDVARLWLRIATIEAVHHQRFQTLAEQMEQNSLLHKEEPILWQCINCGFTYESTKALESCPVCAKGAGWQKNSLEEKKFLPKK